MMTLTVFRRNVFSFVHQNHWPVKAYLERIQNFKTNTIMHQVQYWIARTYKLFNCLQKPCYGFPWKLYLVPRILEKILEEKCPPELYQTLTLSKGDILRVHGYITITGAYQHHMPLIACAENDTPHQWHYYQTCNVNLIIRPIPTE